MATTINDISDLARILEEHPEWAETLRSLLLTREAAGLPERIDRFIAAQEATNTRIDQFIAEQQEFNVRIDRFIEEQRELNAQLKEFIREQQIINRRAEQRFGRLMGESLEYRLHGKIDPLLCQKLDLRRPVVLKSRMVQMDAGLYDRLDQAEDAGAITEYQSLQLRQVDFIVKAQRRADRATVHLAVEVSRTVNEHDIERARARADTLAAVTGTDGLAVVVGSFIEDYQERQARDLTVALIREEEPED